MSSDSADAVDTRDIGGTSTSSSSQAGLPSLDGFGQRNGELFGSKGDFKTRRTELLAEARNLLPQAADSGSTHRAEVAWSTFDDPDDRLGGDGRARETSSASRSAVLDWSDSKLRDDTLKLIEQFLADEGFGATKQMLAEEWSGQVRAREEQSADARMLRKGILEGAWDEVEKLLSKPLVRSINAFRYACYKQIFLELIDGREFQKAFTFLNKRLRGLEHFQPHAEEFKDLCYLLSAKSITDAPSFRSWEGAQPAREALVTQFSGLLEQDHLDAAAAADEATGGHTSDPASAYVPPERLKSLLHMAVAYQVEFSKYHPRKAPRVRSLLHDYESYVIPDSISQVLRGHRRNVKALCWVGSEGYSLLSGSSDGSVRLWDHASGRCEAVLEHGGRVWDVDSTKSGAYLISAGGDGTAKIWARDASASGGGAPHSATTTAAGNVTGGAAAGVELRHTLKSSTGDVYACRWQEDGSRLLAGGYDKLVRLYDATTGSLVSTFTGHSLGITSVTFDPAARIAITASKDTRIRIWDLNSGLAVRTLHAHLGECTSVEVDPSSRLLLSAGKDNHSLVHDLRTLKPMVRLRGPTNTRANFVKSHFAHNSLVASGSEDGVVHLSDLESGEVISTLNHGPGVVYAARWNAKQAALASCGDDGVVRTWAYQPSSK
ncbi:WD40 repeat-like protein [Ceraceosorus guamensis]|uniref:WD40 repeat-containing protein SMU1 n=1 Tax=Ceraceosorus guamensis TaxID=1522189 RepID=A0A316W8V0_9BASI|nr:WD40 repeat-like protein [Ceraceosorus guamensis]PWN44463.1 WD40 repeat-like protein [Ceraceosorus guamensis]